MTKQEFIKKAWGELWDDVSEEVNMKTGWCTPAFFQKGGVIYDLRKDHKNLSSWLDYGNNDYQWRQCNVRPKSLQGIETNNGWTKIESDLSNIKDGVFEFLVKKEYCINDEAQKDVLHVNDFLRKYPNMAWHVYSHFRPIKEDVLPLY